MLRAYLPSAATAVLAAALLCPSPASASTALDASPATVSFNDHGIHDGNWETKKIAAPKDSSDHPLYEIVSAEWATHWPAEELWVATRPIPGDN